VQHSARASKMAPSALPEDETARLRADQEELLFKVKDSAVNHHRPCSPQQNRGQQYRTDLGAPERAVCMIHRYTVPCATLLSIVWTVSVYGSHLLP
jgi:hypothetical protein